jgi:glycosyltransferase involved in cell wall biosynthesis
VRLIGKANGVGLSRDLDLLEAVLSECGCAVTRLGCERRERKRRRSVLVRLAARTRRWRGRSPADAAFDLNIMLEHVWPEFLHQARSNILVPNPEWFDRRDLAFLDAIDCVWAKTAQAEALFGERGRQCRHIGFDSQDRYEPGIPRQRHFLHLAGRSPLKGTQRLLALWRRHPEWPQLTLLQDLEPDSGSGTGASAAANIVQQRGYLDDAALRSLQNSHRFHLCTSEAEGWGHYIAEAMSVAAVTLASDWPPMNELIAPERGLLIAVQAGEQHNMTRLARFDEAALETQVQRLLGMSELQLESIGSAARGWFLANKRRFAERVRHALDGLR